MQPQLPRYLRLEHGEHGTTAAEADWWRGNPSRAFGGQLAAHILLAAAEAAKSGWAVHSLHVHFLAPGGMRRTRYAVSPLRHGRSFALYNVRAIERVPDPAGAGHSERDIALGVVSFHSADKELDARTGGPAAALHAAPMPRVLPAPEGSATRSGAAPASCAEGWRGVPADDSGLRWWMSWGGAYGEEGQQLPRSSATMAGGAAEVAPRERAGSRAPAMVHAAALAFLSDLQFLMSAGIAPARGRQITPTMTTSLDHVIYLHEWPIDASRWLLFEYDSPHAATGRATVRARVWDEGGRLVASAVQEGVYRVTVAAEVGGKLPAARL